VRLHEPLAHAPPASGFGENLDRHWLVSNRARVDRPATGCALARHLERLENRGPAICILAYPPEGAAGAYSRPNGKLASRRLVLDVAVREPKNQNRRVGHARTISRPVGAALLGYPTIDRHNVDDLVVDPRDHPEYAVPANGLANRRDSLSSEVVFDVPVWELDHNRLCVQGIPPSSLEIPASRRRKLAPSEPQLYESLAHAPLVLADEHGAKFCEGVGSDIVEHPEDAFAIVDRQRHDECAEGERLLKHTSCGLVDEADELPNVVFGNPEAGEHHLGEAISARGSASEEGHRQEPGQTGAGVASPKAVALPDVVVPLAARDQNEAS